MIPAALEAGIPLIIGTAGGSGARPHVKLTLELVKEIAKEKNFLLNGHHPVGNRQRGGPTQAKRRERNPFFRRKK